MYDARALTTNESDIRMAKSLEQLKREAEKLQKQIAFIEQSDGKTQQLADQIRKVVKDSGLELEDVLAKLKGPAKKRAARGTAAKKTPQSQDKTGAKPEVGSTYKHSSWPEPWTAQGKRAPKYVIATIQSGKTWASLGTK
jgi:hypothetical protein